MNLKFINNLILLPLILIIKLYQWCISPILKTNCRYLPTCSEYAKTSINRFGLWKGSLLAVKRISRCHPLGSSGVDPVPDKLTDGLR